LLAEASESFFLGKKFSMPWRGVTFESGFFFLAESVKEG